MALSAVVRTLGARQPRHFSAAEKRRESRSGQEMMQTDTCEERQRMRTADGLNIAARFESAPPLRALPPFLVLHVDDSMQSWW
eukprot:3652063-Pleurochrysis_carterae.AAC.3